MWIIVNEFKGILAKNDKTGNYYSNKITDETYMFHDEAIAKIFCGTNEIPAQVTNIGLIKKIVDRAVKLNLLTFDRYSLVMDLQTVESKLDLANLYKADNADFSYNIIGIQKYLDRTTGEIKGEFTSRFTKE